MMAVAVVLGVSLIPIKLIRGTPSKRSPPPSPRSSPLAGSPNQICNKRAATIVVLVVIAVGLSGHSLARRTKPPTMRTTDPRCALSRERSQ